MVAEWWCGLRAYHEGAGARQQDPQPAVGVEGGAEQGGAVAHQQGRKQMEEYGVPLFWEDKVCTLTDLLYREPKCDTPQAWLGLYR